MADKYKLDWTKVLQGKPQPSRDLNDAQRGESSSFGMPVQKSGFESATLKTKKQQQNGFESGTQKNGFESATLKTEEQQKNGLLSGKKKTDDAGEPQQQRMRNYDDIINYYDRMMKENEPETEEQKKKRQRMERSQSLINGIADIGRAFANLIATNNYAPNGYDHATQSFTEKQRERMEKAKADREKRREEYMTYRTMKQKYEDAARDYEDKRLDAERDYKDKRADAKATLALKERELNIKEKEQAEKSQARQELNEARIKEYEARAKGDEAKARYWEYKGYEAAAKQVGDYERAAYYRAKADEAINGTITTTTENKTDPITGQIISNKKTVVKKPATGGSGNGNKGGNTKRNPDLYTR